MLTRNDLCFEIGEEMGVGVSYLIWLVVVVVFIRCGGWPEEKWAHCNSQQLKRDSATGKQMPVMMA